jgi:hypothetical protein
VSETGPRSPKAKSSKELNFAVRRYASKLSHSNLKAEPRG